MLLAVSTAAVFWYGGNRVIEGSMSVGTLVAFLAYHMRLLAPVQALMGLYTNLVTAQVSLERVEVLFRNAPEVAEAAEVAVPTVIRGELELCAVGFTFDERKRMLDGVTWRVGPGQTGLILGPSGAGKSTLADLLVRFYDPQAGMVQLDGVDLRRWPLAKLRETVAVVEQTPWLFPCSVGENLRYGRAEATDEELRQVLRAVGLDETFGNLQAEVGERGLAVSVGQRQRLAIARALLRRPTVLVLDEPTAALDEASEELVTRGIRGWLPHATLVLITHRLKLRGLADTVLEIA
jgi:ATP-binding cassette subfamily B protein